MTAVCVAQASREIERSGSRGIAVRHIVPERFSLVPLPHRRTRRVCDEPRCVQLIRVIFSGWALSGHLAVAKASERC